MGPPGMPGTPGQIGPKGTKNTLMVTKLVSCIGKIWWNKNEGKML